VQALTIFGVTGRMGLCLVQALAAAPQVRLVGAVASPASVSLGLPVPGAAVDSELRVTSDAREALRGADVAIDFSLPQAVAAHAEECAKAGVPLLVGATGLDAEGLGRLEACARRIAVVLAPNTSVGVNVMLHLVARAARALDAGFDVEIHEAHHRMKRDAPSGTALQLGEAVAAARATTLAAVGVYAREGTTGPRPPAAIGFSVVRAGDIVGEHTVLFAGEGERIEITHRAGDRMGFARGALRGAEWLAGRAPGLYRMSDVLGLEALG
jgi:4-hydroxy-tetrahydrodipicolinate reductase